MSCIISHSGIKMYYIDNNRVSKVDFYKKYPKFDQNECVKKQKEKSVIKSLDILEKIKFEINKLKSHEENLKICNSNLSRSGKSLLNRIKILKEKDKIEVLDLEKLKNNISGTAKNKTREASETRKYFGVLIFGGWFTNPAAKSRIALDVWWCEIRVAWFTTQLLYKFTVEIAMVFDALKKFIVVVER